MQYNLPTQWRVSFYEITSNYRWTKDALIEILTSIKFPISWRILDKSDYSLMKTSITSYTAHTRGELTLLWPMLQDAYRCVQENTEAEAGWVLWGKGPVRWGNRISEGLAITRGDVQFGSEVAVP